MKVFNRSIIFHVAFFAGVAQLVVHFTRNEGVGRSRILSPALVESIDIMLFLINSRAAFLF